jgi:molybdopterin-guanine dinucleotide biosynthesis adapter protein
VHSTIKVDPGAIPLERFQGAQSRQGTFEPLKVENGRVNGFRHRLDGLIERTSSIQEAKSGRKEAAMRVIGLAGWSGAGKTTLITQLIPELIRRGFSVSTIKHAHHGFDIDRPGKDSYAHRAAGAHEVLVGSANRIALMRELRGAPEPSLAELLAMLAPVDVVLIEGFKRDPAPKIEVYREANGKPPLHPDDPNIIAFVGDGASSAGLPHAESGDIAAIADLVLRHSEPLETLLERLAR